jgi:hypothetical protein
MRQRFNDLTQAKPILVARRVRVYPANGYADAAHFHLHRVRS